MSIKGIVNYCKKLPYIVKFAFAATFLIGLLVHIFFFVGYYNQWDSIGNETLYNFGRFTLFSQGRPIVPILQHISGAKNLPMVSGIVGLIYLALSSTLITHLLGIKSRLYAVLIGASLVVFPSVACGYSYHLEGIIGGMLVAVLCVYFCRKHSKKGIILGGLFFCLCLQTYQSDIFIVFSLLFLLLILDVLRDNQKLKAIMVRGIRYILSFAIGGVLWFGFWRLTLRIFSITVMDYQGLDKIDALPQLINFDAVKEIYHQFFTHMNEYTYEMFNSLGGSIFYISMLAGALAIVLMVYLFIVRKVYKSPGKTLLLYILLALYPIANCGVFLLGLIGTYIYTNLIFSIVINYIFLIAAIHEADIELRKRQSVSDNRQVRLPIIICNRALNIIPIASIFVLMILIANNLFLTEEAYLKTNISNQQAKEFSASLVDRIERFPGYEKSMLVLFVGEYVSDNTGQYDYNPIVGFPLADEIINSYSYASFIHKSTGHRLNYVSTNQKTIYNTEMINQKELHVNELQELGYYPQDNSIAIIDGVMYIKMSDEAG